MVKGGDGGDAATATEDDGGAVCRTTDEGQTLTEAQFEEEYGGEWETAWEMSEPASCPPTPTAQPTTAQPTTASPTPLACIYAATVEINEQMGLDIPPTQYTGEPGLEGWDGMMIMHDPENQCGRGIHKVYPLRYDADAQFPAFRCTQSQYLVCDMMLRLCANTFSP